MENGDQAEYVHLFAQPDIKLNRRKLIPVLIRIFVWIFMIMGAFVPLVLLLALMGGSASLALYGIETTEVFSATGLLLTGLFVFKGLVALSFWMGKRSAILWAITEALLGILVCAWVMVSAAMDDQPQLSFRLELLLLIPYLIWLFRIKHSWENYGSDVTNPV